MSKISKELIENYRKIVLPFVSNRLYKTNFEGQGETDKTEFEHDFNEILNLAILALNPTGDCISREGIRKALNEAFDCEDATKYGNKNAEQQSKSYSTLMLYEIANIVEDCCDNAPTVEPERPQGKWELNGMIYYCSECGHDCGESGDNFCGNCGSDMRGGATNEKD